MHGRRSLTRRLLDESSSDDDDELLLCTGQIIESHSQAEPEKHGGSIPGHVVIYRDREGGHSRMYQDYLADDPTYGPTIFRRRSVNSFSPVNLYCILW